jgi:hypothetical protein
LGFLSFLFLFYNPHSTFIYGLKFSWFLLLLWINYVALKICQRGFWCNQIHKSWTNQVHKGAFVYELLFTIATCVVGWRSKVVMLTKCLNIWRLFCFVFVAIKAVEHLKLLNLFFFNVWACFVVGQNKFCYNFLKFYCNSLELYSSLLKWTLL